MVFGLAICGLLTMQQALAVPAFARQTGMACQSCHFQHYPTLNAYGRDFKASGYTLTGTQGLIEGEALSTPVALNISLITKLRYQKSNGNSDSTTPADEYEATDSGEIQWPDEAAFLVGGRVGEHIGFLLEHATVGEVENDEFSLFNSYKVHFNLAQVDQTRLSTVLFGTDAGGASYGFELMSTGAQKFMRPIEAGEVMGAAQYLELGRGEATGVALVASNPKYFANLSFWVPKFGNIEGPRFANYLRLAYMPTIGNWDTGFGLQYFGGEFSAHENQVGTTMKTKGWTIDAQAQGRVGDMPLGLYASYGVAPNGSDNFFNTGAEDKSALGLMAELGVFPNKGNVYLAYRTARNGAATDDRDNAITLGVSWMAYQNIKFELYHTKLRGSANDSDRPGGDAMTTLMLFAGF